MSIIYQPSATKDTNKQKKDHIEEHIYGTPLCVLLVKGTFEGDMQVNSKVFGDAVDQLPQYGQHVVILDRDDKFDSKKIKDWVSEDVPAFIVFVNNGDLDDDVDALGHRNEFIPDSRDPKIFTVEEVLELFEDSYNLLDVEDKEALLRTAIPSEEEGEDIEASEGVSEDEGDEGDEDDDLGDFIEDDEEEMEQSEESEYDDMSDDESTASSLEDDATTLKDELAMVQADLAKFIKKYGKVDEDHPKYELMEEMQEQIRKIKEDLSQCRNQPVESDEEEWQPVASRLGARGCKRNRRDDGQVDQLTMLMAKSFSLEKDEEEEDQLEISVDSDME